MTVAPAIIRHTACKPIVREARFSDYEQIAESMRRNGLRARTAEDWIRLWRGNPAYESFPGEWPIGWVLQAASGTIVGSIVNVPVSYVWNGKPILAAAECDWAVDPAYRAYSLALLQRLTNQPNVDLVLTTTAGASAEPGYAALQWSRVPAGQWDRAAFWVTAYRGFAESALRTRLSRAPAAVLRGPVSMLLSSRDSLFRRGRTAGKHAPVEECHEFDSRFDLFWERLKKSKKSVLMASRNRASLSWHLQPGVGGTWTAAVSNASGLVAYGVFARRDNEEVGLRRVRLIDFQSLEDSDQAFRAILSWGLQRCRAESIHVLEDLGCLVERPALSTVKAPYYRPLGSWTFYYKARREDLKEALSDASAWEPSAYDGDAGLQ